MTIAILIGLLSGCGRTGAPFYVLFGAFFPAWLLCMILGVLGSIAARQVFVKVGVYSTLPYKLFVCLSIGLMVGMLTWLFIFD